MAVVADPVNCFPLFLPFWFGALSEACIHWGGVKTIHDLGEGENRVDLLRQKWQQRHQSAVAAQTIASTGLAALAFIAALQSKSPLAILGTVGLGLTLVSVDALPPLCRLLSDGKETGLGERMADWFEDQGATYRLRLLRIISLGFSLYVAYKNRANPYLSFFTAGMGTLSCFLPPLARWKGVGIQQVANG